MTPADRLVEEARRRLTAWADVAIQGEANWAVAPEHLARDALALADALEAAERRYDFEREKFKAANEDAHNADLRAEVAERRVDELRKLLREATLKADQQQAGAWRAERRVNELREALRTYHHWASQMPDTGFGDRSPRWKWWHRRPAEKARTALAERDSTEGECDGSKSCTAARHVHGCFAERGTEGERQ